MPASAPKKPAEARKAAWYLVGREEGGKAAKPAETAEMNPIIVSMMLPLEPKALSSNDAASCAKKFICGVLLSDVRQALVEAYLGKEYCR